MTTKAKRRTFFSNLEAIKEILAVVEKPMSEEEIARALQENYLPDLPLEVVLEDYVQPLLAAEHTLFERTPEGYRARLENYPEHRWAREVLEEEMRPLSEKELRKRVARRKGLPVKFVRLYLEKLPDLFRAVDITTEKKRERYWLLRHWEIANDRVYQMLRAVGRPFTENEIKERLRQQSEEDRELVFFPEADDRFQQDAHKWKLRERVTEREPEGAPWAVEEKTREKVARLLPKVLEAYRGSKEPLTLDFLIRHTPGAQAKDIGPDTLFFAILLSEVQKLEQKGLLIRVRPGPDPEHLAWRLKEEIPPEVYTVPETLQEFQPEVYEILTDAGLAPDLRKLLQDEVYYFYDGDFAETAFPPGGVRLLVTSNAIETGALYLSPPVRGFLAKQLDIRFGEESPILLHEVAVLPEGGEVIHCWINTRTFLLWGLGPWLSYNVAPGQAFHLSVDEEKRLHLEPAGEASPQILPDEAYEKLFELRERKDLQSLRAVLEELLEDVRTGLRGQEILDRVTFIRRVSRRHLFSVLSAYFAFRSDGELWRLARDRKDWGRKPSSLAYARDLRGRSAYIVLASQSTVQVGHELRWEWDRGLPELQEFDLLLFYAPKARNLFAAGVVKEAHEKEVRFHWFQRWEDTPEYPLPDETKEVRKHFLTLEYPVLVSWLADWEKALVRTWKKKKMLRQFVFTELKPVMSQRVQDDLEALNTLWRGAEAGLLDLQGIHVRIQTNPTFEEFQRILEEHFYSRGKSVRLDRKAFLDALHEMGFRFPCPLLGLPAGDADWLYGILLDFHEQLREAGYAVQEEAFHLFLGEEEKVFPLESLFPEPEERERLKEGQELTSADFLRRAAVRFVTLADWRDEMLRVARVGLSLFGVPHVSLKQLKAADLSEVREWLPENLEWWIADGRGLAREALEQVVQRLREQARAGRQVVLILARGLKKYPEGQLRDLDPRTVLWTPE